MEKAWMDYPHGSLEYRVGVLHFLRYAFDHTNDEDTKPCPCRKCINSLNHDRQTVHEHLLINGILRDYRIWSFHGEKLIIQSHDSVSNDLPASSNEVSSMANHEPMIQDMLREALGIPEESVMNNENYAGASTSHMGYDSNVEDFYRLVEDSKQPLYAGCTEFSKLTFLVELFQLKVSGKWSDKSFTTLLEFLRRALPSEAQVPNSFYEAKKLISKLGLGYEKIHACPNDCMIYWRENKNEQACKVCNLSRWKDLRKKTKKSSKGGKKCLFVKTPAKVFWYFPLKPRLQRLFMSTKTAENMQWHSKKRVVDGILRHPADSQAWKAFDERHHDFASDVRNVRLGLAADGFNPFKNQSVSHSTWPIVLMPYNLPPWESMKSHSIILSTLIPGPKAPGNDIDVYLQPLLAELKDLWENGMPTYDACSKQMFQMHAALLWTISDFPGLGCLSGWNTYAKNACPTCADKTDALYLKNGKKWSFRGHRRFLSPDAEIRKMASYGKPELRELDLKPLSGSDVLEMTLNKNVLFGKSNASKPTVRIKTGSIEQMWRKRSIFFSLPYWEFNLIRHNLDPMHIEKNVCDNILGTLLNDPTKNKDNVAARRDLKVLGIMKQLWLQKQPDGTNYFPAACYSLSKPEKKIFCSVLKDIRVPDGMSSDISKCVDVERCRIMGLKSHDCHVIMEYFLPIALRRVLSKKVVAPLIILCEYFKAVCGKSLREDELQKAEEGVILALCQLERIFPPSFFTIMVHLVVHLAYEARVAGPVNYRWMYPIERYLGKLKNFVRNRARPEANIAEAYLADECVVFCSRYLEGDNSFYINETRHKETTNFEFPSLPMFPQVGRPTKGRQVVTLDVKTLNQAHRYILSNCAMLNPYREEFKNELKRRHRYGRRPTNSELDGFVRMQFADWFAKRVDRTNEQIDDLDLRALSYGPNSVAFRYHGFNINGFAFRTVESEQNKKNQNSGVMVQSAHDNDDHESTYYGRLTDVISLDYGGRGRIVLFRCDWVNITNGVKIDPLGFEMVNFSRLIHTGEREEHEPFILASQAQMVYYVCDPKDENWYCVIRHTPRDIYNMGDEDDFDTTHFTHNNFSGVQSLLDDVNVIDIELIRTDVEGSIVEGMSMLNNETDDEHSD
ncbi:uncharacterized protein [Primulina eburnea]|uniref:uncharacterized protein n=1 Tax=Primulina eburnea TaxID=1245227 RepID=UPI003C6BDBFD